ncbi:ABC transporter substrate-binding protein [Actinopolymorpha sp. B17G11]|uniref:ABC transporter substrate-binding protein n=1 Tax=Actinopolymorpha sp. B17G11 TaxID=3160861 RepID=UPI0032E5033D
MRTTSRRATVAGLALMLATSLAAAACSPAGSGMTGDGGGGGGAPGKDDGPFIVARTADIDLVDPARATAFPTVQTLDLVYDTLLETDDDGELEPGLATEWTVGDDGRTVTLTLRNGVEFHNGETFTAADAKATLERILDEETGSVVASYFGNVDTIETPDDQTLVLTLRRPDTALLNVLTYVGTSMLDQQDIEAGKVQRAVNGTGAYRWTEWEQGQKVTLTANRDYWDGAPTLPTVELRVIPDESSILSGMVAGSLDLGLVSDPSVAKQVDKEKVQLLSTDTLAYHVLQLNGRRGPLRNLAARQAIACALDRDEVIDTAYFGTGEATGPITSPAYEFDALQGLPCDPPDLDAARSLLEKAGHPDGFTLDTIVMVGNYATASTIAQSVQAQLAKIGVRLKLQQQQSSVYVKAWLAADYDAAVAKNGGSTDPYLMYGRYFEKNGSLAGPAGLADEQLDQLLRDANATTDPAERELLFGELQQEMLRLSPWVWIASDQSYYLVGKDVKGFKALPTDSLEYLTQTRVGGS